MDALHILSGLYKSLLTVISGLIKNCSCPPTIHRPFMGDFLPKVPIQPRMDPMPVQSRILYLKWSKKSYALDWCWEKRVSWERTTQMTILWKRLFTRTERTLNSLSSLPKKLFVPSVTWVRGQSVWWKREGGCSRGKTLHIFLSLT